MMQATKHEFYLRSGILYADRHSKAPGMAVGRRGGEDGETREHGGKFGERVGGFIRSTKLQR